jgi:hypothetical protein
LDVFKGKNEIRQNRGITSVFLLIKDLNFLPFGMLKRRWLVDRAKSERRSETKHGFLIRQRLCRSARLGSNSPLSKSYIVVKCRREGRMKDMEQLAPLSEYPGKERERKKRVQHQINPKVKRIVYSVLLIAALWGGGYFAAHKYIEYTHAYIDQQIKASSDYNKQEFDKIQQELQQTHDGLAAIQEQLALTGETIHGTDKTKQALEQRMTSLDQQLNDLKASLQKLEAAARAW